MSPEQLLDEKERYEAGTGRPPRPKDLASMALLRRLASPAGKGVPSPPGGRRQLTGKDQLSGHR
jgi:hypothetical protein